MPSQSGNQPPTGAARRGLAGAAAAAEFEPAWALPPGTLLRAEIVARGVTQADLAARTRLTEKHISQVINGVVTLTPDVAVVLERTLGVPARTLLLAEARWQSLRTHEKARESLAQYKAWARKFPLDELKRRKVLRGVESGPELVERILSFFGVADPDAFEKISLAGISGFRRAQHLHVDEYATAIWLRLGELQTARHPLPPYDPDRLRREIPPLRRLTRLPDGEGYTQAREVLAECGVALAFIDGIRESRACGATRWLSPSRPLIVLSDRYGHKDTLWFSLMHEIGHLLRHPRRRTFVNLSEENGDDADGLEAEANRFAADVLVPERYRERLLHAATRPEFESLAAELDVDVSVVAGQRGYIAKDWPRVQRLRRKLDVPAVAIAAQEALHP
jgi:HTH-type transcriptional regulator/antitoxin HigA